MKLELMVGAVLLMGAGMGGCGKGSAPAATTKGAAVDPMVVINGQIDKGIALLEAGKNKEALEKLANPIDLKKWKKDGVFDKLAEDFGVPERAGMLLATLKEARGQTPTFNDAKTQAEYPHKEGERALIFTKNKEGWYIQN